MNTSVANAMELAKEKTTLDRHVVNLFRHKAVLAVLMQRCVKEFRDYTPEYIMKNCFAAEPVVQQIPVDQNVPGGEKTNDLFTELLEEASQYDPEIGDLLSGNEKITGIDSVDKTQQEGTVIYDIVFLARVPKTGSLIQMVIDIEIQNDEKLSYEVATRGIYYGARLISMQKNRVFQKSDYQRIQKVYSIWICPFSKKGKNTITSYDIQEHRIFGDGAIAKAAYDKLETIVITLDTEGLESENDLIRFLSLLIDKRMPVKEREEKLQEEYHLQMTERIREDVNAMCNYSDAILRIGERQGEKRGWDNATKAAQEKTQQWVRNLHAAGTAPEIIARSMELSVEQVKEWIQKAPSAQ